MVEQHVSQLVTDDHCALVVVGVLRVDDVLGIGRGDPIARGGLQSEFLRQDHDAPAPIPGHRLDELVDITRLRHHPGRYLAHPPGVEPAGSAMLSRHDEPPSRSVRAWSRRICSRTSSSFLKFWLLRPWARGIRPLTRVSCRATRVESSLLTCSSMAESKK